MLSLIIPAVLALASSVSAIPVGSTSLPGTQELFVYEGGTQIGCVNGYGNFTTDLLWCFPFRAFTSTDGFAYLSGYAECSTVDELIANSTAANLLTSWLHIRHPWIGQVAAVPMEKKPITLKLQTWRDLLNTGIGGPEPSALSAANFAKVQRSLDGAGLKVSQDCTTLTFENGEMLRAEASRISGAPRRNQVYWNDSQYDLIAEGIPEYVQRQILWELHQLNFRYDLLALDTLLGAECPDVESLIFHQQTLQQCWGSGQDTFYAPSQVTIPTSNANTGLTSDTIQGRLPSLRNLYEICKTWPAFDVPDGMDDIMQGIMSDKAEYLEGQLYSSLQQTFYDVTWELQPAVNKLNSDNDIELIAHDAGDTPARLIHRLSLSHYAALLPCPLLVPSQCRLFRKAYQPYQQPAREDWATNQRQNSTRRKQWIFQLQGTQPTTCGGMGGKQQESEPYELKSDDIVEFGIDIVGEDNKTVIHHKVAASVVCVFSNAISVIPPLLLQYFDYFPREKGISELVGPTAYQSTKERLGIRRTERGVSAAGGRHLRVKSMACVGSTLPARYTSRCNLLSSTWMKFCEALDPEFRLE
ncbi:hypothetical protein FIBSPDRAFT_902029 [Athelia psychrophila]|uniref:Uncharacterized protein n=1 Tax=Athelia psychrophila TaxID=1759441 RepID=A0A167XRW6_9AGAM|nr:hypothetical protein FIBSPDRAFT_902029 [Fibularhizoctonia sp. CBS 109695]